MDLSKKQKKPINKFKKKKKFKWTRAKTFVVVIIVAFLGIVGAAVNDYVNDKEDEGLSNIAVEGEYSEEVQQAMEDYKSEVDEKGFQTRIKGYENNVEDIAIYQKAFDDLKSYKVYVTEYDDGGKESEFVSIYQKDRDSGISSLTTAQKDGENFDVQAVAVTADDTGLTYMLDSEEIYAVDTVESGTDTNNIEGILKELITACGTCGFNKETRTFNGAFEDFEYNPNFRYIYEYGSSLVRMGCNEDNTPKYIAVYNIKEGTEIIYTFMEFNESQLEKPDWCVDLDKK